MTDLSLKHTLSAYQGLSKAWTEFQQLQPEQPTIDMAVQR